MKLRIADRKDLSKLKMMYKQIVDNMNKNGICIWDDIYPCEFLQEDIENNRLYVLETHDDIVSAIALCQTNSGEDHVKWSSSSNSVLYIDRFGVNVNYLRQGIGSLMLSKIIELVKEMNIQYLRLFVVDINEPAIKLYIKNGFQKVPGVYDEMIDEELTLHEYGFEIKI